LFYYFALLKNFGTDDGILTINFYWIILNLRCNFCFSNSLKFGI